MRAFPDTSIHQSEISDLRLLARGKVRDVYELDENRLAIVATDRLSAYDVVLPDAVPGKGAILTALSDFWFDSTKHITRNHRLPERLADVTSDTDAALELESRTVIVKRLQPLPIEAVVRGYLIGSGWRDYQSTGAVCGELLPENLALAARLPEPVFTPATKAAVGDHDENIDFEHACSLVGRELALEVRRLSISLYEFAAAHAIERGIILADTKFEFGTDAEGELYLIDEALTPDSSRYWDATGYVEGTSPPSFDKQIVRDHLEETGWDKRPPGPAIPAQLLQKTRTRYIEVFERLVTRP